MNSVPGLIMAIGAIVGSVIGGYLPALWGAGPFSMSGILFSALGAIIGVIGFYKLYNYLVNN